MDYTKDQLRAIETRDRDLIISASAGTGKTAVLIERIFRLISEDGIDITRMLAITYTEKAARELKSKMATKLNTALEEGRVSYRLIEEELEKLEWADISTIHSFCKKIATENFSISKIDPAARVLDEGEMAILLQESIEAVIREEVERDEPEPALLAYTDMKGADNLSKILTKLYFKAASYDEPGAFFERSLKASEGRSLSSSLLRLAIGMTKKYKSKKLELKLIDFDDMQYYALAALEDEAVREAYRQNYDYIFVDEYQDTSYVQDRLISLIARPGSLFIVGDYKQSIYGFRNARPELFLKKHEDFRASDRALCVSLNDNFRSEYQVIRAVNEIFSEIMTEDFGGIDYKSEAKLIYPPAKGSIPELSELSEDKRTRLNFIDLSSFPEDSDIYEEDYAYLALIKRIKELKELGYSYNDICVLLRSPNKQARKLKRLFEDYGLSLTIDVADDLFLYPEIRTLMDFLKVASNPFDDEALLAVLRSPIGKMGDDELFILSQIKSNLGLSYYAELFERTGAACQVDELTCQKLKAFYARLEDFKRDETLLLRDRLERLMREVDYLHYLLGRVGKEALLASYYEFLDYLYEFEKKKGSNLSLFIETHEDLDFSGSEVKVQASVRQGVDSVKLVSIHKSKGLQYKVVILFGAEKDFTRMKPGEMEYRDFAFDEGGGLLLKNIEREKGITRSNPKIEEEKLRYQASLRLEEERLLYVALTRAEVKLEIVISGKEEDFKKRINQFKGYEAEDETKAPKNKPRTKAKEVAKARLDFRAAVSYADFLISALDFKDIYDFDFGRKNTPILLSNHWEFAVLSPEGLEKETQAVPEEKASEQSLAGLGLFKVVSYPSIELPVRRSVTSLKEAFKKEDFDYNASTISKDGARRGSVYHSFMQFMVLNAKTVEEFLALNKKRGYLAEEDLKLIDLDKIRAFVNHPLFERISKAKKVWKEKPFIYQTEIDGKPTQIQGIIDLAFVEKKSLVIVDYKSDRLKRREDFIKLYKTQLDIYTEAVEAITGLKVGEKLIYSFELGELIEV